MSYARIFLKFFIMNNTITPVRRVGGGCSRRKPPSHLDLLATVPVSERGRGPRRRCTGPAAARGETRKSADRFSVATYTHTAPRREARGPAAPRGLPTRRRRMAAAPEPGRRRQSVRGLGRVPVGTTNGGAPARPERLADCRCRLR